jgi:transposase
VYPVNPKSANQLRKAAGAKTDQIDAYRLPRIGRFELAELRRLEPDSPIVQELKTLTRDQDALIQMQTRLVNQLTACLKEYYPAALHLFSKLHQHSTLVFLQAYPTPESAASASVVQIEATLRTGKHSNPRAKASRIVAEVQRPQLSANAVTIRTKSRLMLSLVKQLLVVIAEIASYESLVQALAGTAPVPLQSGNYAQAHQRLACLKPLRNALYQFAWQSTQQEAWAASYYRRKRAEGKSHSKAVRALANIWVRIIYRLWVNKTCYHTATFEAAQLAHAPRPHVA